MKKKEIIALISFFLLAGPGPTLLFINKYSISLFPLICMTFMVYVYRVELMNLNVQKMIYARNNYAFVWKGVQWSIYFHAATTLLIRPTPNLTDQLLSSYPIMAINIVIFAPIFEEIVYRKIIFRFLCSRYNFVIASAISSSIFALGHFSWDRFLAYFGVGILFCKIYKDSNSIYPTILAHMILNFIAIISSTLRIS
ncbi:type II CAAX endopeptidase family protein [Paenibacillus sp. GD4]|uniref:CPBP family intramembrane glutamic endopeptidase n=1 Tax=Paenibacillus sp. GD4 TaxID=3068890 RepID=UPI002796D23C|nr:type II CAAX endopeptidase family protein [Paenibacillus sp. GD4]MDQ1909863.1 type II CAAX endopeptidase family protein [Paenibacillus sp. GD4]